MELSIIILFVMVVAMFVLRMKFPAIKGAIGERFVNKKLSELGASYRVFHDLYVPTEKGGTTQVDHVVTSPYGVFVIETKHYDGWILGQENQKYWTQVIYKRKEKLYNPIWQNYGHIQAIKKYIGKEEFEPIHSIIAFSSQSTFKFKENFKSAKVIQFPQLLKVIKEWNEIKISEFELKQINRALESLLVEDKKEKKRLQKQHVQSLKTNLKNQKVKEAESIKQNRCPKCGGELSLKKGKYGSFYGCGNYPRCRYTKKV
ncbi:NERD domain-containing protein [Ureibacillus sp. MALMAid1270]|uniref:nuclease-related domain-containing protein n=1 Tax=Ureibacillus sp. MALMAid1270 TaxID=3411629 RepID=UPI003BA7F44D